MNILWLSLFTSDPFGPDAPTCAGAISDTSLGTAFAEGPQIRYLLHSAMHDAATASLFSILFSLIKLAKHVNFAKQAITA